MKVGDSIKELQAQMRAMQESDPEGYARVTKIHHKQVPDHNTVRGEATKVTGVELDDNPEIHAVDLTLGPWKSPV